MAPAVVRWTLVRPALLCRGPAESESGARCGRVAPVLDGRRSAGKRSRSPGPCPLGWISSGVPGSYALWRRAQIRRGVEGHRRWVRRCGLGWESRESGERSVQPGRRLARLLPILLRDSAATDGTCQGQPLGVGSVGGTRATENVSRTDPRKMETRGLTWPGPSFSRFKIKSCHKTSATAATNPRLSSAFRQPLALTFRREQHGDDGKRQPPDGPAIRADFGWRMHRLRLLSCDPRVPEAG